MRLHQLHLAMAKARDSSADRSNRNMRTTFSTSTGLSTPHIKRKEKEDKINELTIDLDRHK
jgi:hypothetical protein